MSEPHGPDESREERETRAAHASRAARGTGVEGEPSAGDDRSPNGDDAEGRTTPPGPPGEGTPVDEPSGAQGTGGTGLPVTEEPGAVMPEPVEVPGRVRRRAEPEPEPAGGGNGEDTGDPAVRAALGWLPDGAVEIFGPGATAALAYDLLTVDVPAERWIAALESARDELGCTYFDWLSAVDEPGTGFRVCVHVAALPAQRGEGVRRLLVRTTVPHDAAVLPTATAVYAGAAWHERETHEMFGVDFTDHPHLVPLLLPDGFEGHPLRKDFVLAARVAKAWPGAKEPGESGHGGPKRRQMLPPGVPDPNEWGPLKGRLPAAPARSARGRAGREGGDRPVRRTRSASAGSASQRSAPSAPSAPSAAEQAEASAPRPARPPRRSRSASEGSASQRSAPTAGQEAGGAPPGEPADAAGPQAPETAAGTAPRSVDAPWHQARPTFDDGGTGDGAAPDDASRDDTSQKGGSRNGEPRHDDETGGGR